MPALVCAHVWACLCTLTSKLVTFVRSSFKHQGIDHQISRTFQVPAYKLPFVGAEVIFRTTFGNAGLKIAECLVGSETYLTICILKVHTTNDQPTKFL